MKKVVIVALVVFVLFMVWRKHQQTNVVQGPTWVREGRWSHGVSGTRFLSGFTLQEAKEEAIKRNVDVFIYHTPDQSAAFGGSISGDKKANNGIQQVYRLV